MAFSSAVGGNVVIPGPPIVRVPVAVWSASWRARDCEATHADSGGGALSFPVAQDNSWEYRCARDDVNFPEAVGFASGQLIAVVYFKLGTATYPGSKGDKLENTLVTDVLPVCDAESGEVIRVTVKGKGGTVTKNQDTF